MPKGREWWSVRLASRHAGLAGLIHARKRSDAAETKPEIGLVHQPLEEARSNLLLHQEFAHARVRLPAMSFQEVKCKNILVGKMALSVCISRVFPSLISKSPCFLFEILAETNNLVYLNLSIQDATMLDSLLFANTPSTFSFNAVSAPTA